MRHYRNDVTQERLKQVCHYEAETGFFTWKSRPVQSGRGGNTFNARYAGKPAGRKNSKGYVYLRIDGLNCAAHRLAWLYHYGCYPKNEIDHINRKPHDNRISNLRDATSSENNLNKTIERAFWGKGVCFDKSAGKYLAYGHRAGRQIKLGRYLSEEEAIAARQRFFAAT